MTAESQSLPKRIAALQRERGALILAHTYQNLDVQDVADFVGDSLELSRRASEAQAPLVVFCGVRFMAETAKLLSPRSTVLLPAPDAGCFMADMIAPADVRNLRQKHPGAAVVAYVNSTAEVKAESDICCTSANALAIVESVAADEVIMLPDRNLARYVASRTRKTVRWFDGCCPVHVRITRAEAAHARELHPNAMFLAHPECEPEVLALADHVLSTSGMLAYVREHKELSDYLIGTEATVAERLARDYPSKVFHTVGSAKYCLNMRKTGLADIVTALETDRLRIDLDPDLAERARLPIERMLRVV